MLYEEKQAIDQKDILAIENIINLIVTKLQEKPVGKFKNKFDQPCIMLDGGKLETV